MLHFQNTMKSAIKILTGIAGMAVLGATGTVVITGILSLDLTLSPFYEQILLGLGVFALLGIAYGMLDQSPPDPAIITTELPEEKKKAPPVETPAPSDLSGVYEQLRTYIDLEMWELALDRANHILETHPDSREAIAIERNINELRWKAEPKFVERKQKPVSKAEAGRLKTEGLSRFIQHIRTYMELEMWELAKQKASALLKSFPESDAAKEAGKLWPEIERNLKQPSSSGVSK